MSRVSTKPISGMRDFLPEELAKRRYVVSIIQETYERYGFLPLETPSMEHLAVLRGNYGDDEKLIYKILHRGEVLSEALQNNPVTAELLADQALRYDLTVPFARVVANYSGQLPRMFRRYQIQPVWRADRPGRGRFREFYQCDADVTGTTSLLAEAEVCGAACEALHKLGFHGFTLQVNHRSLLRAFIAVAGILESQESTALIAVDKLDKIGREGVLAELEQRGISSEAGQKLLSILETPGGETPSNAQELARLQTCLSGHAQGELALQQLAELLALFQSSAAGPHVRIMPKLARGLGYYTGAIFEITVPDLQGSLGGGGRYDDLIGMFAGRNIPAVGFSLGLERILVIMGERQMFPPSLLQTEALLCWLDVAPAQVLEVAARLREQGVKLELFPEKATLSKQLQYAAEQAKVPFALILGADEFSTDRITCKTLSTGEQETLPTADVIAHLRRFVSPKA